MDGENTSEVGFVERLARQAWRRVSRRRRSTESGIDSSRVASLKALDPVTGSEAKVSARAFLLLVVPLALALFGSTCVIVEEGPEDIRYGEESNAEAMEEEMDEDVVRDSER
jgi:hypothetical protein